MQWHDCFYSGFPKCQAAVELFHDIGILTHQMGSAFFECRIEDSYSIELNNYSERNEVKELFWERFVFGMMLRHDSLLTFIVFLSPCSCGAAVDYNATQSEGLSQFTHAKTKRKCM